MINKKVILRAIMWSVILALFFSVTFSLSDVNFQWEYLTIKSLFKNFGYLGIPIILSTLITTYSTLRARKNRNKDDSIN